MFYQEMKIFGLKKSELVLVVPLVLVVVGVQLVRVIVHRRIMCVVVWIHGVGPVIV